jgi:hypothetical protein
MDGMPKTINNATRFGGIGLIEGRENDQADARGPHIGRARGGADD